MPIANDVDLAEKLAFLGDPASYPDRPCRVERRETHMAWIFLTERRAYKLKKPVRYSFLDFSTATRRRADCEAELQLNRRLSPNVYREVTPLTLRPGGGLALGGEGEPVDWLVVMERLDEGLFLDRLIEAGEVPGAALERALRKIAAFYGGSPPVAMSGRAYVRRERAKVGPVLDELERHDRHLPREAVRALRERLLHLLDATPELFGRRAEEDRLREGHGDLRPEHVWLGPEPQIIDCLEFDRDLRIIDPADELAFLGMEARLLGASDIGAKAIAGYAWATGDRPPGRLVAWYTAYRAALRAQLCLWHSEEPGDRGMAHWLGKARRYLDAAVAASEGA